MNDREKIKEILKQAQEELHRMFYEGVINNGGRFSTSDLNAIKPYDDVYADAFIAAGFGDVSEYKHRAEVAERALKDITEELPCSFCCYGFGHLRRCDVNNKTCLENCLSIAEQELAEGEE